MKAVILAGGLGSRLSEETSVVPKPMVMIGHKPILWHIMKIYSKYNINDFIVCCGFKKEVIYNYFINYANNNSTIQIDIKNNNLLIYKNNSEPWTITLVDTGEDTATGGRLSMIKEYVSSEDCFCMTYGDGLSNIDIDSLIRFHRKNNKLVTVTAVLPPARFGSLILSEDYLVKKINEKIYSNSISNNYINGGFFVISPNALDYIQDEKTAWELEPLSAISNLMEMVAYIHDGFWHPMDTLKDKNILTNLWNNNVAPWKIW